MEITIGVQFSTKELRIETDEDAEAIRQRIEKVVADAPAVLWLTDTDGRQIGVPADKVAYIELGTDKSRKSVGFSTH
jgi:hypothetical protein